MNLCGQISCCFICFRGSGLKNGTRKALVDPGLLTAEGAENAEVKQWQEVISRFPLASVQQPVLKPLARISLFSAFSGCSKPGAPG